jgi:hypothetical protein
MSLEKEALTGRRLLVRQDNNVRFTTDTTEVRAFTTAFESIWSRPENTVIQ